MGIGVYTALYHNHMYFSRHFDPGDSLSGTANLWKSHVKIDYKKKNRYSCIFLPVNQIQVYTFSPLV